MMFINVNLLGFFSPCLLFMFRDSYMPSSVLLIYKKQNGYLNQENIQIFLLYFLTYGTQ